MGKLIFLILTILMIALAIYFGIKKYQLVEQRKKEKDLLFDDKWKDVMIEYEKGDFKASLVLIEEVLLDYPTFKEALDMREALSEVIKKKRIEDAILHSESLKETK